MIAYYVMVEGVFVHAPELGAEIGGFHTTFYLRANSGANAVHRVAELLDTRMRLHQVSGRPNGVLRTYCWVHSCMEIAEEDFGQCEQRDTGFTFFRIGWFERFHLAVRRLILQRYKPWGTVSVKSS